MSEEAKQLLHQMRTQINDAANTAIQLLRAVDESPSLITILGTVTSELHDMLKDQIDEKA